MFSIYILTSVDHLIITLISPRGREIRVRLGTLPVLLSGEQVLQVDMLFYYAHCHNV
jgi:hypothetical protein